MALCDDRCVNVLMISNQKKHLKKRILSQRKCVHSLTIVTGKCVTPAVPHRIHELFLGRRKKQNWNWQGSFLHLTPFGGVSYLAVLSTERHVVMFWKCVKAGWLACGFGCVSLASWTLHTAKSLQVTAYKLLKPLHWAPSRGFCQNRPQSFFLLL